MSTQFFNKKNIHRFFVLLLIVKGILAILEIVGGVAVFFINQKDLINFVQTITQSELIEDPHDIIANYLLHLANDFSISTKLFVTLYLLSHGIIKFWLIVGLLKKILWYYPIAIAVFGFFIIYQFYRYNHTHSLTLLLITALDLVVIFLTWKEYYYLTDDKKNE